MKLACLLSEGFEDLEALGTIALLRRSSILCDIVSVFNEPTVKGSFSTTVVADIMLKDLNVSNYDGLFIPGGRHSFILKDNPEVLKVVKEFHSKNKYLFAICAAPSVFGVLGILDDKKYISFPTTEVYMKKGIRMREKAVRDGKIITAVGAGAVYEFAFLIIETLLGKDKRQEIEKRIQYYLN